MKDFIKAIGIAMGVYGVAMTFSLGVLYGIKAQQRTETGTETAGDKVLFNSVNKLDESVEQLRDTFS
jgi:hypothetical protein